MKAIPYLFFKGTANEAMAAYAEIFKSPRPRYFPSGKSPPRIKRKCPACRQMR